MSGSALVALAAATGNLLQGWDNATIAGALLYIKKEFNLQSAPTIQGLIMAMSLIGATVITTFSGPVSDSVGRRPMLIISSVFYFLGSLVMLWAPNVYILLIARLLDGFGIGLAVTLAPVYISETAPPEIRGLLNTLPQFIGSVGMFFSYCMVFGMSLMESPSWRLMLGLLSVPSVFYFALMVMFLPESPRWLVSKGRMAEAKQVLQRLRGREDVSGEMALLVEGLGVGSETSIEEYIIAPVNELSDNYENVPEKDQIRLYGPEEGVSLIAKPVTGQSTLGLVSRQGSVANQISSLIDPVVALFGSVHENLPEVGSRQSMFFPTFGSMFNMLDHSKNEHWDAESLQRDGDHHISDASGAESDDNLRSPLLSRHGTNAERDMGFIFSNSNILNPRHHSSVMQGSLIDQVGGTSIGGGWQLAYKVPDEKGKDGKEGGGLKRIYLHPEGTPGSRHGSIISVGGGDVHPEVGLVHASALVSQSALRSKDFSCQLPIGEEMAEPSETAAKDPGWGDLFEPGVKHALAVGVGLQMLQQFSGISGVLYYTPQILEQAGVGVLLSHMGIRPESASLLISAIITLLMLPSIGLAMRLMDFAGRRWLLLSTLPVLLFSLVILVFSNIVHLGSVFHAVISTVSVVVYICSFVMGFGPIPNILCSEIFPTRVRGLCIAICALTFWFCDIIVTYSLPVMLSSIGLGGVFGIFAIVCAISWFFVYRKVPETKGMPLEVITEFFAVGAKQVAVDAAKD